jgi:hypothetical protein
MRDSVNHGQGYGGIMDARFLEELLRKVVREELAALGYGTVAQANLPPVERLSVAVVGIGGPFLLSERELMQAESLLSEEEGKILRQRVYAARAEQQGNRKFAARLRRKADLMEQGLRKAS